jgi:hypothetical protein
MKTFNFLSGFVGKWAKIAMKWAISDQGIITLAVIAALTALMLSGCHHGTSLAFAAIVTGTAGGKHVVDGPLTTEASKEASPELLLNEIDKQIVKIRPMATPIDQISRCGGAKHSGSMMVDYYNVDTKLTNASVIDDYVAPSTDDATAQLATINTSQNGIFDISDTILVKGVKGYNDDGATVSDDDLVLYVMSKADNGALNVVAVNGKKSNVGGDTVNRIVPSIPADTQLIRMGRASSELDVQTAQFEALPQKAQNYCQIFKMQIEQSTLQKIANKEVNWSMTDQEEAAIYDMRLGMEKNFLFGVKRTIYDSRKKEHVLLTGGIWHQAGKTFKYSSDSFTQDTVIDMMKEAFTGNAGSKRKVLIGGSNLIGLINKLDYTKVINAGENVAKWGIDFSEMSSKFGKLYVLLSEVFDECGMANDGMIIDPEYIQKYSHLPFGTEALDLKAAGMRNTDALVLTEASCLVLRYPKAHMRIIKQ